MRFPSLLLYAVSLACALSAPLSAATWQPYGPAPQANGYYGSVPENVAGRCSALAYSPDYDGQGHAAIYLGTASGGVWRTSNLITTGPTWVPLTDHLGLPPAAEVGAIDVGSIAVDPNHPRTIYVGTGEANFSLDSRYGAGILKSTDGGDTWALLGNSVFRHQNVSAIIVDPTDTTGNTVYCSITYGPDYANWGVYKSTNGGVSWTRRSQNMPNNFQISSLDYTVDASGNLVLYAGAGYIFGDTNNGVWRSTDGALSWTRVTTGLPSGANVGRVSLACDHTPGPNPSVYALVNNSFQAPSGGNAVYKSTDHGLTWLQTADPGDFGGSWYQLAICVAPPNGVYVAGLGVPFNAGGVRQSLDGGATWYAIDNGTNGVIPHTDHHALLAVRGAIYDANDGGIFRFHPRSGGAPGTSIWYDLNTPGLQTIQINALTLDPNDPATALEGSQDNGFARRDAYHGNIWTTSDGGDGGVIRIDPADGALAYRVAPQASYGPYDFFQSSTNAGRSWNSRTDTIRNDTTFPGSEEKEEGGVDIADTAFPFYPVFTVNPANASRVALGSTMVYETYDSGATWRAISTALEGSTGISALAFTPSARSGLYVGYGNGRVYVTTNDGQTWTHADVGAPWGSKGVSWLAVDPDNPSIVYLTVHAFGGGKVFRTTDRGATWTNISGNLPDIPVNTVVLDPRTTPATLYLGADLGVWQSTDLGATWTMLGDGLPSAQVVDLVLDTRLNRLAAGTHGRGAYMLALAGPLPGDVDGNGVLETPDAVLALQIAGGLVRPDAGQAARGDVLPGRGVRMDDAAVILRRVLGTL